VYVKNFEYIGMHSQRLITIYLQNTNAAFHTVVQRHYSHYSGEVGNIYISLWQI